VSAKEAIVFPLPSPYAMQCTVTNDNGDKETVTVVIVPTSFTRKDAFTWQIGYSCVPAATMIRTENGYKGIENIREGQSVLAYNLNGQIASREVTRTFKRPFNDAIYRIKPLRLPSLRLTPEHPILVKLYKHVSTRGSYRTEVSDPVWLTAENVFQLHHFLRNNMGICVAKPFLEDEKDIEELNEKNLKILGWYMAEGSYASHRGHLTGIRLTLSSKERPVAEELTEIIREEFNANPRIDNCVDSRTNSTYIHLNVQKVALAKFIRKWCAGKKARVKKFNHAILSLPRWKQKILIDALMLGDGTYSTRDNARILGTSSRRLSLQVLEILMRLGVAPSYSSGLWKGGFSTERKPFFAVGEYPGRKFIIRDKSAIWTPIRKIDRVHYSGYVYNLAVTKEQNYITESFLIHNCSRGRGCKCEECTYSYKPRNLR